LTLIFYHVFFCNKYCVFDLQHAFTPKISTGMGTKVLKNAVTYTDDCSLKQISGCYKSTCLSSILQPVQRVTRRKKCACLHTTVLNLHSNHNSMVALELFVVAHGVEQGAV
jgi:hypothetical protein